MRKTSDKIQLLVLGGLLCGMTGCSGSFQASSTLSSLGERANDTGGVRLSLSITSPESMASAVDTIQLKGDCAVGRTVKISGSGLQTPAEFVCDGGSFIKNMKLSAGDGIKNVIVSQEMGGGIISTASRSFMKDATAPVVSILSPAAGESFKSNVTLAGSCEAGLLVQFYGPAVASETTTPCTNGSFQASIELSAQDGSKSVYVGQTDKAGNYGSVARSFVRDNQAPVVTLTSPAANSSASSGLTLSGTCESDLMVEIGGAGLASPLTVLCQNSAFSAAIVFSSGDGAKVVTVKQTDKAGNQSEVVSRSFNRLGTGPAILITQPAANSLGRLDVTIAGTCVTGLTIQISGTGVATNSSANCVNGSFSSKVNFSAGEGAKNIIVSQRDAANNLGQDSRSFIRDSVAPVIAVASPVSGSSTKGSATLVGTCESGLSVAVSGSGVAAASSANCQNGMFSASVTLAGTDGTKALEISQTDGAGNRTLIAHSIVKDTTPPQLQILEPSAGTQAPNGVTVKGSCETGIVVELTGSGLASPASQPCVMNAFSASVLFSANDGKKLVSVSQTDLAGNITKVDREFVRGQAPAGLDGAALYANNCMACHGALVTSTKRGRSVSQINTAIAGIPTMTSLMGLTNAQREAIATALSAPTAPLACTPESVQKAALRRINSREFANSIRDVLGVVVNEVSLPRNDLNGSGYDTDGSALRLSDLDSQKYLETLQAAMTTLFSTPVKTGFDYTCPTTSAEVSSRTCTSTKLSLLAKRALKKNLTATELARYVEFARKDSDVIEGLKSSMTAMLMSPYFLYLNPDPTPAASGAKVQTLSDLEFAHRLSLMLWSSVPDDTLMSHVTSGKIKETATLKAQVIRMVADAKFKTGLGQGFVDHWLELYKLNGIARTDSTLPGFSEAYLKDMIEESRLFVQYLVKNDRPMSEILTGQYSFLNQRMAQIYGVNGSFNSTTFTMSSLPAAQRSGIMTHPSILTLTGKLDSTSPVKRGFWMTKRILCSEPPPPPPDIPVFDTGDSSKLTIKERLAAHRTNVSCAGCHSQMDPVGIGLENFSQIGRWRTSYGAFPVDATESFDSNPFNGPIELGKILAPREDVKACVTSQIATYALGRATSTDDACYIKDILNKTDASATKGMLTLLQEMVDSPMFKQYRVGN